VTAVVLEAKQGSAAPALIKSEKRQHVDSRGMPTFEPSTEVGILESLRQDVYLVLHGVSGEENAEVRITFNPLVWWVWYGGLIMALGGLIVMWPQATRQGARRAEGGYVVTLQPERAERAPAEAGV
jgi:cytochrome c-type biogenesis protein CcmF